MSEIRVAVSYTNNVGNFGVQIFDDEADAERFINEDNSIDIHAVFKLDDDGDVGRYNLKREKVILDFDTWLS
jgi:hypothetical protein